MARIYVASLSDYNAGLLMGCWIDLDGKDAAEVQEEIAAMLRTSKHPNVMRAAHTCEDCDYTTVQDVRENCPALACPDCDAPLVRGEVYPSAEEWSIHDYDDCPDMGENPSLENLLDQVRLREEYGDAWEAYVDWIGSTNATEDHFEECRAGEGDSERDWLENHIEEIGLLEEMPEHLKNYFDASAYLNDLKHGGEVNFERVNGNVYAFWTH